MSNFNSKYISKNEESKESVHDIILRNRQRLEISGVKGVESFDSEEFLLDTIGGFVAIKGHDLQMKNLDVVQGKVSIIGRIDQFAYVEESSDPGEKGKKFFQKLFK